MFYWWFNSKSKLHCLLCNKRNSWKVEIDSPLLQIYFAFWSFTFFLLIFWIRELTPNVPYSLCFDSSNKISAAKPKVNHLSVMIRVAWLKLAVFKVKISWDITRFSKHVFNGKGFFSNYVTSGNLSANLNLNFWWLLRKDLVFLVHNCKATHLPLHFEFPWFMSACFF